MSADGKVGKVAANWLWHHMRNGKLVLFVAVFGTVGAIMGPEWIEGESSPTYPARLEQVEKCRPVPARGVDVDLLLNSGWSLYGEDMVRPPACEDAPLDPMDQERGAR